jgi:uncharacterized protein GlcG (DUF336 family)
MIRKKPALGLDPGVEAGFPNRSCTSKNLEPTGLTLKLLRAGPIGGGARVAGLGGFHRPLLTLIVPPRAASAASLEEIAKMPRMPALARAFLAFVLLAGPAFAPVFAPALAPALAQQPTTPPYGPPITLDDAKRVMAAAELEAAKNSWQVAITILDSGSNLVMFHKIDNTQLASVTASEGKARTALTFKRPSKVLDDAIAAGGAGLRLLAVKDITPLEGGIPILIDGKIIGAIGVSGALSSQDAQVAKAGADALAK